MIFRLIPTPWLIAGALVAIGAAGLTGYRTGVKVTEARVQAAQDALQADLNEARDEIERMAAQILEDTAKRQGLIDELENAARSDPDAVNRVPSPDSLQRLRSRWGADGG